MPGAKVPYVTSTGRITAALEKMKAASTPERFTQDFLSTKLGLKGGSAQPVIPFLKRTGFLASDGSPTDRYKRFRNPAQSGAAAAEALREGYAALYEVNEYAHKLSDNDLRGVVVQVTGSEPTSSTANAIVGSFKALRAFADFDQKAVQEDEYDGEEEELGEESEADEGRVLRQQVNLGYTINLHLPPTSDIAVFNAIFKSLREHLLK